MDNLPFGYRIIKQDDGYCLFMNEGFLYHAKTKKEIFTVMCKLHTFQTEGINNG